MTHFCSVRFRGAFRSPSETFNKCPVFSENGQLYSGGFDLPQSISYRSGVAMAFVASSNSCDAKPIATISPQIIMHLGNAIVAHEEWMAAFRRAIADNETFDVTAVCADNACDLGQWLYGEGKRLFGDLPVYSHCLATHKRFHLEAAKIAAAINAQHLVDADGMLAANTPFSETSRALAVAIAQLRQDAALAPGFISLIAKLSRS